MRKLFAALILLAVCFALRGQSFEESMRFWDEGPLTWDDLNFKSPRDFRTCDLTFRWMMESKKQRTSWNTIQYTPVPRVALDKAVSWHNTERQYPFALTYDQAIFDLNELYFRKMLQEEYSKDNKRSTNELYSFYSNLSRTRWSELSDETDDGMDSTMVAYHAAKIAAELAEISYPDVLDHRIGDESVYMSIGFAGNMLFGDAAKTFSPAYGIDLSSYFGKKRHVVMAFMSASSGTCLKDFTYDYKILRSGDSYNHMNLGVAYGYTVYDGSTFTVIPLAGIGLRGITWQDKEGEKPVDAELNSFILYGGVEARLKLHRIIYDSATHEHGLSFRAFMSRDFSVLSAFSLNFMVSYNFGIQ